MFGLFSNKIPVAAVQKGKYLKRAIEKDLDSFLECRLHNKPRKAFVGLWLVLFEDKDWVYWGYPKFRMIFSDSRVVDELFKTDKKRLIEKYPDYKKDFRSVEIKQRVREEIIGFEKEKDGIIFRDFVLNEHYKVNVKNNHFVIQAKGELTYTAAPYTDQAREEKQQRTYNIELKMDNLELVQIN